MADIKCVQCDGRGVVYNPDGTEIVALRPVDQPPEHADYLIFVCPSCAASTVAVYEKKKATAKAKGE